MKRNVAGVDYLPDMYKGMQVGDTIQVTSDRKVTKTENGFTGETNGLKFHWKEDGTYDWSPAFEEDRERVEEFYRGFPELEGAGDVTMEYDSNWAPLIIAAGILAIILIAVIIY